MNLSPLLLLLFVFSVNAENSKQEEPKKDKKIKTYVFDGSKYKKSTKEKTIKYKRSKKVNPQFTCDDRVYCSDMTSYEEALFFLRNCPDVKMDGDYDGIPCERQRRSGKWSKKKS